MTGSVVFISKHDILNILAFHLVNMYLTENVTHKEVLHPNWSFGVAYTVQPFL